MDKDSDVTTEAIDFLLRPRSIAIIGASDRKSAMGNTILQNFKRLKFAGPLYAVHPKHREVEGFPCFPSVKVLPEPVDAVAIALGREKVIPALQQAIDAGARAAAIFASGFSEVADGRELEADLRLLCSKHDVKVVGPNCLGLLNVTTSTPLYSSALPDVMIPGDVAVISQSGSGCIAMICSGRFDFSFVVSSGNEATTTAADYVAYAARDDETKVIAVIAESIRDPENFAAAADAALAANKPVVVLKIGRSSKGMKAAAAHTGSLIGPFEEYEAFFERHGVIVVDDLDELIETLDIFRRIRSLPAGDGVGVMNLSGGINALICDVAEKVGVDFPVFVDSTRTRLEEVLPDFAVVSNPLDGTGVAVFDMEMYTAALEAIADDPGVDLVGVSQDMPAALDPVHIETAERVARTVVNAASNFDKPVFLITNVGGSVFAPAAEILRTANIPVLQGSHEGLLAVKHLGEYSRYVSESSGTPNAAVTSDLDEGTLRELRETLAESTGVLSAEGSVKLFSEYGIEILRGTVVVDPDDAAAAASAIGYPVVLKVESSKIHHKTEVGGVITGIPDEAALRKAFEQMRGDLARHALEGDIEGYLVQPMVSGGVEAIVGSRRSDLFGSTLVVGPGGVLVELLDEAAVTLVPASDAKLSSLVDETPLGKLLAGYRGVLPSDREAFEDLLTRVSRLLTDVGDLIDELDLNPVTVLDQGKGLRILDVLVVTRPTDKATMEVES